LTLIKNNKTANIYANTQKKKMKSNKLGVALVKRLCPNCLAEENAEIVLNTRLSEYQAKKVEDLHGKVVGFSEKLCDNCKKEGFVLLIGIFPDQTNDFRNPYRSGNGCYLKDEVAYEIFDDDKNAIKILKSNGWIYVHDNIIHQLQEMSR
jgi:hypothetical protein